MGKTLKVVSTCKIFSLLSTLSLDKEGYSNKQHQKTAINELEYTNRVTWSQIWL